MRTKNELYQEALRTVARRRQTARAKAEDARAEAEAAVPGLRHAEEEVRVRGIRCALAGAAGKDRTDAAAALTDARKKLADLLASSGRPAGDGDAAAAEDAAAAAATFGRQAVIFAAGDGEAAVAGDAKFRFHVSVSPFPAGLADFSFPVYHALCRKAKAPP